VQQAKTSATPHPRRGSPHRVRRSASARQHYNYFRDYEPGTGRYVESDPIGLAGGLSTYGYALQNPLLLIDPLGLDSWACQRPLCVGGNCSPGTRGPPVANHQYLCTTTLDGKIECGGQSSDHPGPKPTPGRPTRPDEDWYDEKSCDLVDDDDDRCIEACLLDNFNRSRPTYAVGPRGTDCQEWADDLLQGCKLQCRRPENVFRFRDR